MFGTEYVSQDLREQAEVLRKPLNVDIPSETPLGTFLDRERGTTTIRLLDFPNGDTILALVQKRDNAGSVREVRIKASDLPALARAVDEARRLVPPVLKGVR